MGGQLGRQPGGQSVGRLFSKDIDIIKALVLEHANNNNPALVFSSGE